jgi:acyl-CoA thioesterase FadM
MKIGTKSITLHYEVRTDDGRLVADATTVHVAYDYDRDAAVAVPDEWRRRFAEYEGNQDLAPQPSPA